MEAIGAGRSLRGGVFQVDYSETRKEPMRTLILTHKVIWIVFFICLILLLFPVGCMPSKESGAGFRIPEGSVEMGKMTFVNLECINCHSIAGVTDLVEPVRPRDIHVVLGGETTRVKTYGQLVTSIIYPSHIIRPQYRSSYVDRDGNSEMPDFTENMSVRQMIDLVTFLETTYKVVPPPSAYEMAYGEL